MVETVYVQKPFNSDRTYGNEVLFTDLQGKCYYFLDTLLQLRSFFKSLNEEKFRSYYKSNYEDKEHSEVGYIIDSLNKGHTYNYIALTALYSECLNYSKFIETYSSVWDYYSCTFETIGRYFIPYQILRSLPEIFPKNVDIRTYLIYSDADRVDVVSLEDFLFINDNKSKNQIEFIINKLSLVIDNFSYVRKTLINSKTDILNYIDRTDLIRIGSNNYALKGKVHSITNLDISKYKAKRFSNDDET